MSVYDSVQRGGLKLKVKDDGKIKKKKKNKSDKEVIAEAVKEVVREEKHGEEDVGTHSKHSTKSGRQKTEAELKFEERQKQKKLEKLAEEARLSHKDKVQQFNDKLAQKTDINEMPKLASG